MSFSDVMEFFKSKISKGENHVILIFSLYFHLKISYKNYLFLMKKIAKKSLAMAMWTSDGDFLFYVAMRVTAMAMCEKSSDAMAIGSAAT